MGDPTDPFPSPADSPYRGRAAASSATDSWPQAFRSPWVTYPMAAASVLVAYAIRRALHPVLGAKVPLGMFYAAMLFGAWFGGLGPALLAMVGGLVAAAVVFNPSLDVFANRIENHIGLVLYLLLGVSAALVAAAHERALRRAEAGESAARQRETQLRTEVAVRQAAEAARRQQDDLLRLTTDASPVLTCYVDLTGHYRLANRTYRAWYQLPAEGVIEATLAQTLGADEYTLIEPRVTAALSGRKQEFEMSRSDPRGEARMLWVNFAPDVGPTLEVRGFVAVITDVTESRRGEATRVKLAAIVESSDDAIIGVDLNGLVTSWNEGAQRLFGYAAREIIGRPVRRLLPAEEAADVDALLGRIGQGQSVSDREAVRIRSDGTRVDVSVTMSPVRDVTGRVTGASTIARDITEIKRVAGRLRASEERYRELAEALPQIVWRMRVDGTPEYVNAYWYNYTGLTAAEMEQGDWSKAIHPDDLPAVMVEWDAARREMRPYQCECRVRRNSDGAYRWFQARALPVKESDGTVKWIGTAVDIDDQKRAVEALREGESRFRTMANSAPVLVWMADVTKAYYWFNKAWIDFRGRTIEQEFGHGWAEGIHPQESERALETYLTSFDARREFTMEYRLLRHDGEYRWLLDHGVPRYEANGEFAGYIGSCIDITDRKAIEDDRNRLLASEQAARAEAERASQLKDDFLANLSHELRTPLNAILGWSQLLRSTGPDEEDFKVGLETIERNARVQTQLVEDLLDMSRIISGKIRLNLKPTDLSPVIEAGIASVLPGARAKQIELNVDLDPAAGQVSGDASRLQQIVWNLLSNAVKFTPEGGSIGMALRRRENRAEIVVSDTGAGIAAEFLPRVFDRFIQADSSTTRRFGGMGMGLAIVRHLIDLHGGSVRAESIGPGQGSTFTISLPVLLAEERGAQPADADDASELRGDSSSGILPGETSTAPATLIGEPPVIEENDPAESGNVTVSQPAPLAGPSAPMPVEHGAAGGASYSASLQSPLLDGIKVLVVDDDPDAREVVRRLLSGCRATVTTASSAAEALSSLDVQVPDILVSDIGMPGEDGYALIRKVRSLPAGKVAKVPAVALTAFTQAEDHTRAVRSGFQAHLPKPVQAAALIAAIAGLTGRAGGG